MKTYNDFNPNRYPCLVKTHIDYGNFKQPLTRPHYNCEADADDLTAFEKEILEAVIEFLERMKPQNLSLATDNEWQRLMGDDGFLSDTNGSRQSLNKTIWQYLNRNAYETASGLDWNTKNWQNFRHQLKKRMNAVATYLNDRKPYKPDLGGKTQSSTIHKRMKEAEGDRKLEIASLAAKAKIDSQRTGRKKKVIPNEQGYALLHSAEAEFSDPKIIDKKYEEITGYKPKQWVADMMNTKPEEQEVLYFDKDYRNWMKQHYTFIE